MKFLGSLFENLGVKITALLFALALYGHVITERQVERVLHFPLALEGVPDSLALRTSAPEELSAHVRGTGKQIIRLSILRPRVTLRLEGIGIGHYQRSLTSGDFASVAQEGVEVLAPAEPTTITLQIEPRASARVPVAVRVQGEPARGFVFVGEAVPRPSEVRISGPHSWVRERDSIETEPVLLTGKRDTVEIVQPLLPPPPWTTVSPGSVLVRVPIEPEDAGARDLAPQVSGLRPAFQVRLDPPRVRVEWAAPRSLAAAALRDLRVDVDLERRGRGRYVLPVRVGGRAAGFVRSVTPESVAVVVH